jgi:hypothetical protein
MYKNKDVKPEGGPHSVSLFPDGELLIPAAGCGLSFGTWLGKKSVLYGTQRVFRPRSLTPMQFIVQAVSIARCFWNAPLNEERQWVSGHEGMALHSSPDGGSLPAVEDRLPDPASSPFGEGVRQENDNQRADAQSDGTGGPPTANY